MSRRVKLATVQPPRPQADTAPQATTEQAVALLEDAAAAGCDVVCLPEYVNCLNAPAKPQPSVLPWPNGALGRAAQDKPRLTPSLPDPQQATGAALVICPGGGYALFLKQYGITGFVLHYRLAAHGYRHPAMLEDAARAVRLVRAQAARWKPDEAIDSSRQLRSGIARFRPPARHPIAASPFCSGRLKGSLCRNRLRMNDLLRSRRLAFLNELAEGRRGAVVP